jgi:hypothetical protein
MIDTAALARILMLRYGEGTGTCYLADVENRQYLLTASHVVPEIEDGHQIALRINHDWFETEVRVVEHLIDGSDITVLALPMVIARGDNHEVTAGHLPLSGEVYFAGYPFARNIVIPPENQEALNWRRDFPFVKRGIVSALNFQGGLRTIYIDAQANPGFSGSPIFFRIIGEQRLRCCGVLSAGWIDNRIIQQGGNEVDLSVIEDAGMCIAYATTHAVEAILRNPVGPAIE